MSNTMQNAIEDAVQSQVAAKLGIMDCITPAMRAALEAKFNALPIEVRSFVSNEYKGLSVAELYIVRQMRKEANAKLASNDRPVWYNTLSTWAPSLLSSDKTVKEHAEKQLRTLAESLDSKESATLVKKYKQQTDRTSNDSLVKQLCGIFGIETATIK